MQASKKRDKFIKIIIIIFIIISKQASQTFVTRRNKKFMLTQ